MAYGNVFIAVGSNIEPRVNIPKALELLTSSVKISGVSSFYETLPLGNPLQEVFFNGVLQIETELEPLELKHNVLRSIEDSLGRVRSEDKNAPREIDLDIVVFEDFVLSGEELTIPDPDIFKRDFIALPLLELSPGLLIPPSGRPLKDIVEASLWAKNSTMKKLSRFSASLLELLETL